MSDHEHEHMHEHDHEHTHADGTVHSHPHEHAHTHDHGEGHEHTHEHLHDHEGEHPMHEHSHDHPHAHEHTHEHHHEHSHGDAPAQPMEQLYALMKYMAGHNAIYCDTDSVKYVGNVDWSEYNQACIDACHVSGAHATDAKGVEHYMGVFEPEDTVTFVTLGSKKYAYQKEDGKLVITVAGVGKSKGAEELRRAGGLPAFKNGLIFSDAGGLESIYNDEPGSRWIEIDGHHWEIGPNIYLKPATYTMGQTAEYMELLQDPLLPQKFKQRFC